MQGGNLLPLAPCLWHVACVALSSAKPCLFRAIRVPTSSSNKGRASSGLLGGRYLQTRSPLLLLLSPGSTPLAQGAWCFPRREAAVDC